MGGAGVDGGEQLILIRGAFYRSGENYLEHCRYMNFVTEMLFILKVFHSQRSNFFQIVFSF